MTLEYLVTPPGTDPVEYSWETVIIGINSPDPLNGFRVQCRPFIDLPQGGVTHPAWELIDQTITISLPECGVEVFGGTPGSYLGGEYSEGGIVDGTGYIYTETFTQSNFWYLRAYSGSTFDEFVGEEEAVNGFPDEPYDPDNDVYPMDTVTRFSPDDRAEIVVQFDVTTTYRQSFLGTPGGEETETISIFQTVRQPNNNWAAQLKALLERCYFYHGIYH